MVYNSCGVMMYSGGSIVLIYIVVVVELLCIVLVGIMPAVVGVVIVVVIVVTVMVLSLYTYICVHIIQPTHLLYGGRAAWPAPGTRPTF
jgi:hypothetical protein